jgi:hypothetical protein
MKSDPGYSSTLVHEYDLYVIKRKKGIEYRLVTTEDANWTYRYQNKEVINVLDNDIKDEISIKIDGKHLGKQKITYGDLEQLRLVLDFIAKIEPSAKYKIIEDNEQKDIQI